MSRAVKGPVPSLESSLRHDQRGLANVEYIVLLTCIAVAAVLAWKTMGKSIVSIIGVE